MNLLQQLWHDEAGYILSAEAALLGTLGVAGATIGLGAVSKTVNDELTDAAYSFRSLNQSYCIEETSGCGAWTAGSCFTQQDVEVSRAELGEWIEQQRAHAGRSATPTDADADDVAPARPTDEAEELKRREEFEQRRREHEENMKRKSDDRPKKIKKKKRKRPQES